MKLEFENMNSEEMHAWARHSAYIGDQTAYKTLLIPRFDTIVATLLPDADRDSIFKIVNIAERVYRHYFDEGQQVPSITFIEAMESNIPAWSNSQSLAWKQEQTA